MNVNFFYWYIKEVLLKFVGNVRQDWKIPESEFFFFSLDGEMKQLKAFLKDDRFATLLTDNRIHGYKHAASTTSVSQPLDTGNVFKAMKTFKRGIQT